MVNPMQATTDVLYDLLKECGVDTDDIDIAQNVINAYVCIDNAYRGYDSDGNKVGVIGETTK